jgi:hypothetical protein
MGCCERKLFLDIYWGRPVCFAFGSGVTNGSIIFPQPGDCLFFVAVLKLSLKTQLGLYGVGPRICGVKESRGR